MEVHHVAYAVKDIVKASAAFEALGYVGDSDTMLDEERGVLIRFMSNPGGLRVELVAPAREGSPVSRLLERERGSSTPYHICYETDDIDTALGRLKEAGFVQTQGRAPAPAIGGMDVAFAFSPNAGLVELLER